MFEKAARIKLRFNYKGLCTVEDLWDLPLRTLDSIFKELNATFKTQKEESLLDEKSDEEDVLNLQISIIRHVVEVQLREQKERANERERAEKKQKLLGIIAEKQDAGLRDLSIEELTNLVNEL